MIVPPRQKKTIGRAEQKCNLDNNANFPEYLYMLGTANTQAEGNN